MLAYWVLVVIMVVFIVVGGNLDFSSWLITVNPLSPISIPFTWLIIPIIVLGTLGTYAAWSGIPLKGLPRPKRPFSQYNPFRRKRPEVRDDEENE
jgi:hypothetical protein